MLRSTLPESKLTGAGKHGVLVNAAQLLAGPMSHAQRRTRPYRVDAFVGGTEGSAHGYHDSDFKWEEHKGSLTQHASWHAEDILEPPANSRGEAFQHSSLHCQQGSSWEAFHARDNASAKFYKERRYLLLEFPNLLVETPPLHVLELGCGCGSSVLPVLKANPTCLVTATDVSPTAVEMLKAAAQTVGIGAGRLNAYPLDGTMSEAQEMLQGLDADVAILIFTLAALPPLEMPLLLQSTHQGLKKGGRLLIRDHGLLDLTHLRLHEEQRLGHRLYKRKDGTLCYFFSKEDLQSRVEAAGFVTKECKYACVNLLNRKTGQEMKRVFVHGVFEKL